MQKLELLILIGPPGCGKGTLAVRLERSNGYHPVSTGALLRQAALHNPALQEQLASGTLTPDATLERLLIQAVKHHKKVLLDGYPRTIQQVWRLDRLFPHARIRALHLDVPDTLSLTRIRQRLEQTPPEQRRPEDTPEVARHRLEVFHQQTAAVIGSYTVRNLLGTLDGRGTPDEVHRQAREQLRHPPAGQRRSPYRWKQLNKFGTQLKRIERRRVREPHHYRDQSDRKRLSQQRQAVFLRQNLLAVCRHGQPLAVGDWVRPRHGQFSETCRTGTVTHIDTNLARVQIAPDAVLPEAHPIWSLKRA